MLSKLNTLLFLPLILFFCSSFTNLNSVEKADGSFVLVALAIWLVTLFVVRIWMLRYVLKLMNKKSEKVIEHEPQEMTIPEEKATNKLKFASLDKDTDHSNAIVLREQFVKTAYLLFRKKLFYGILATVIYVALPILLSKISGESVTGNQLGFTVFIFVAYLIYILSVFYFHRKQFRAENANFGFRLEHPAVTITRKLVNPRWESFFSISIMLMVFTLGLQALSLMASDSESPIGGNTPWFGIGLIIATIVHALLFIKLKRISQQTPNMTLLILRVFGNKKQALLTFGRLINFWRHFGSWFTVVDPSYLSRKYRIFTFRTLFMLVFLFFISVGIGLALESYITPIIKFFDSSLSPEQISEFTLIPGMIIAWSLYMLYWKFNIWRSYAESHKDIKNKIRKTLHNPRKLDLTFKYLPMFCFDNTWKLAVSEFIKNSKADGGLSSMHMFF